MGLLYSVFSSVVKQSSVYLSCTVELFQESGLLKQQRQSRPPIGLILLVL